MHKNSNKDSSNLNIVLVRIFIKKTLIVYLLQTWWQATCVWQRTKELAGKIWPPETAMGVSVNLAI